MKSIFTQQISEKDLKDTHFDLIISASGYETRARFLIEKVELNSSYKFFIGFNNNLDLFDRELNDKTFINQGYTSIMEDGNNSSKIECFLEDFFFTNKQEKLNILVDYSSMTRIWYASILNSIRKVKKLKSVHIFFSYSVSEFASPPEKHIFSEHVEPVEGFYSLSVPQKPTALIIGLGYEKKRAFGLKEYFNADRTFLFHTDNSFNKEYAIKVIENNKELISEIDPNNIVKYPLMDLVYTETLLRNLCLDLMVDFRAIIAPCGPKPFTLLSMITSINYEAIDVWRISAGKSANPVNREPTGDIVILKAEINHPK